jgi:hypothetical protein
VALIDADVGLRNLDLLLGLENRVLYTAIDILEGDCRCACCSHSTASTAYSCNSICGFKCRPKTRARLCVCDKQRSSMLQWKAAGISDAVRLSVVISACHTGSSTQGTTLQMHTHGFALCAGCAQAWQLTATSTVICNLACNATCSHCRKGGGVSGAGADADAASVVVAKCKDGA